MELIKFLEENQNTRKIFGKREIVIIEKQMFGIRLTQSEKNRLSRDIRRKFEFIKEISKYDYDFELKKGSEIKKRINNVLETIKKDELIKSIKKVILFGSTVENKRTFRSDVDIAVEFKDEISLEQANKFRIRILGYFNNVDIQVYNFVPDKIKKEIDKKGKLLYER